MPPACPHGAATLLILLLSLSNTLPLNLTICFALPITFSTTHHFKLTFKKIILTNNDMFKIQLLKYPNTAWLSGLQSLTSLLLSFKSCLTKHALYFSVQSLLQYHPSK